MKRRNTTQQNPRVITGKYKGRKLVVPPGIRPITDRVKIYIFDKLSEVIEKANVADIFSGSGSLGIEALSRGASFATFVDREKDSINSLERNLTTLGISSEEYEIQMTNYYEFAKNTEDLFDIVFMDPPFSLAVKILNDLADFEKVLKENGIIILKLPSNIALKLKNSALKLIFSKKLGINTVYFIQKIQD
jgi:16S rRNA (guanine966-N2)-methyltransferase